MPTVTGSDNGDECGFQALTVPSDEADTTAQIALVMSLRIQRVTRTRLVLIAQQNVIHPVRVYLSGLTESRGL